MRQTVDKLANQTLKFILPLTAFLVPLFFLTITPNFFSFNKRFLIYILASVSLIAFSLRTITRRRLQITLSPATKPLLALVAIYIISSVFQTPNTTQGLFGHTSLVTALAIIFITTTSSQKNSFITKSTITSLIASVSLASLVAIYQSLEIGKAIGPDFLQSKTFNPIGGPLPLLTLTLTLLPATIYLGIKNSQWFLKLLTFTGVILMVVASIFQINYLLPSTPEASLNLLPLSAGWSIAVDIFKNWSTALLGTGPETFATTFTRLRPLRLNYLPVWNLRYSNSTNEILTILTTTGLLGLVSFITSFTRTISNSQKSLTSDPTHKSPLTVFTQISLISSFIILFLVPVSPTFLATSFILLAITSINLKLANHEQTQDIVINLVAAPKKTSSQTNTANTILPWVYASLNFIIIGLFWFFAGRMYQAAVLTKKAINTLNTEAVASYNYQSQAYNLDPTNPTYRINFSQTSLALANSLAQRQDLSDQDKKDLAQLVEQAIREAKNATTLDPVNVFAWENLANLYRQLLNFAEGASDWTIASYSQAISLDPTNPALRLDIGGVLLSLKDYDNAVKFFEQAIERKSDWANAHYNLSSAYKAKENYPRALAEMRIVVQLLDPNTEDYQKAQDELQELENMVPATTPSSPTEPGITPAPEDIQLVTPTPIPSPVEPVDLPDDAGPDIPEPEPTTDQDEEDQEPTTDSQEPETEE
jgi:tetratricopeptide (TPR) repeat protein